MADAVSNRVAVTSGYYTAASVNDNYGSDMQSAYIPKVFSKRVLEQFYNESTAAQLCNTWYEGDIKNSGDSVVIRKDPTITVNEYSIGGTVTYQVPKEDALQMYIDQALYTAFKIDTVDDLQSDIGLPNRFQEAATREMKEEIDKRMFEFMVTGAEGGTGASANIDASNKGTSAGASTSSINLGDATTPIAMSTANAHQMIVYLNAVLDEAKIKKEGRWAAMAPAVAMFLKLSDLKQADVTGDPTGVIRTGIIGQVDNTDIYVTNHMAVQAGDAAGELGILAGTDEYCSFAAQIMDEETLPIPDSFGKYFRALEVYGREVTHSTAAALAIVTVA